MTTSRQPAGIPAGGQFAADSQGRAAVSLNERRSTAGVDQALFYVTAHDAGRRAILAGPFDSYEAAEAVTDKARTLLSGTRFKDTIGAFVDVGVIGASPRPGRPIQQGKFNEQLMPPPQLKAEMTSRDVIVAGMALDKQTSANLEREWYSRPSNERDEAVKAAWNVVQGTGLESNWRETTLLPLPVRFAAIGAATRGLTGANGYTGEHYDLLSGPWRKVVGPISEADDDLRLPPVGEWPEEPEDEYGRHELDYDDPRNMDLYDGD